MITSEAFDSVVCLVCGSAPKIVYTDGNTKVWLECYILKKRNCQDFKKGSLASDQHNLSVSSDFPPSGFSYTATYKAPPGTTGFKRIDNKKCQIEAFEGYAPCIDNDTDLQHLSALKRLLVY